MPKRLDELKKYADVFGKGLLREIAPEIAAGIMIEMFRRWDVTTATITRHVNNNSSLWERLDDHDRARIQKVMRRLGSTKWITPEWFIASIKKDYPAVASLILGWPEAQTWLIEQMESLKSHVIEETD